ncbi:MraY family glycosyltransferase [Desulfocucumis palustris]|uniref:MraY family glycosyltransferase n=1 Tax=Desulfocucumis palustris TaxID=1898651 RepID=UPI000CEA6983|nr:MraY family glycosyltransferase [Desulfocucumis palustris]
MFYPIMSLLAAFAVALLITPWVRKKAFDWGAVDHPDQRKVHSKLMPRLGGLAVYLAFVPAMLMVQPFNKFTAGLLVGITIIILLGIADDIKGISPWVKLSGQIVAAAAVIPFGIKVDFFTNPFNGDIINLGIWAVPVTIFWLIAVTNAINLIDGLDGLAAGVSGIAALTMAAVAWTQFSVLGLAGQSESILLPLILAASILGFLKHNYHPATIFLGDSGSMLLGFSLGAFSVVSLTKSFTAVSVILPLVILGIPLLDTICAILRRYQKHKPIFQPDREHLHHQLMALGFTHAQAVLVIYGISLVMGVSAVVLNIISTDQAAVLLLMLSALVLIGANKIGVLGNRAAKETAINKKAQERS